MKKSNEKLWQKAFSALANVGLGHVSKMTPISVDGDYLADFFISGGKLGVAYYSGNAKTVPQLSSGRWLKSSGFPKGRVKKAWIHLGLKSSTTLGEPHRIAEMLVRRIQPKFAKDPDLNIADERGLRWSVSTRRDEEILVFVKS
jgi:hypothetical protein